MAKFPFSVFKRTGRRFYYVSFKNDKTGEYLPALSTKQETESAAIATAFAWLKDGIPRQGEAVPLQKYTLRDMAREADISPADCDYICKELQRRGLLKSYILTESKQSASFTDYLQNFWDYDNSPYIKEKLRRVHSIHRSYTHDMEMSVRKYWLPFFPGKLLGEINRQDIEAFMTHMETLSISPKRKNKIAKAGFIPVRYAYRKELIDRDPTAQITMFSGTVAERQILTPELAAAVFKTPWKDDRAKLANMLAMVTGMRAGEIQALRVQDLGKDCLYVRSSWNPFDKLKTTKNNEPRIVEVPFPGLIQDLVTLAKNNPHGTSMDSFVFWAEKMSAKPIEQSVFRECLREALQQIGMTKETAKDFCFHSWRHYFSAYMRDRINDKLLQSQTGHKTLVMLGHYSGHKIAGDRERIRTAQLQVFGELLPNSTSVEQATGT
jgi:integrase